MAKPASPHSRPRRAKKPRLGLWCAVVVGMLVLTYVGLLANSKPHVTGHRLRLDEFAQLTGESRVKNATILGQDAYVVGDYVTESGATGRYNTPYLQDSSQERLVGILLDAKVPTTIKQQFSKRLIGPATMLLPALIVVVVFVYLILSYQRGSGLFGLKSGAQRTGAEGVGVTFDDVAGQPAAVTELREIRDFLAEPGRFSALGAMVPKGVLLFGPPGCGKTLLARAVAGEAGAAFYSISGSDFVELYVGVGAARVRDLFKEARENAPAIVFIDELDAVGRRRGGGGPAGASREEQEQALNQILTELDGFSPLQGIIVIGATNRPDILDPALLRPGRFDRTIGLERPDEAGRLEILSVHARNKAVDPAVDLADVARRAVGLSGADLASVMNEGALLAARAARPVVGPDDLDAALARILGAPERQRRLSMRERSFGRSTGADQRVTFADVAGVGEALEELAEVKEYLADPDRFVDMGAHPPRGFLLVGPPGCGKTMLARAVATEANAAFFSVAGTQFVEVFVGEGAGRVRDLFAEARSAAPSIVFIDEIDAIGARRGAALDGQREREQTLNQILVELDGFEARTGVIVLAATNRPEILDEALVRPGRFDRTVAIEIPDRASRREILEVHAAGKRLSPSVDLSVVAGLTQGFSGADLANMLNESALLAVRRNLAEIGPAVMNEAIDRARMGISRAHALTAEDRTMVAYHEAGHALVGLALTGARRPHSLSIVARGGALGMTRHLDDIDRTVFPRSLLIERMAGDLGGRAAEELVFGEPGSGAADDLRVVTDIARRMVCELGMSEALGPLSYADGPGPARAHSEEVARTIDAEARRLVVEAYDAARAVLAGSRKALDSVADALVARERLSAAELDDIVRAATSRPRARPGAARTRG